DRNVTGVQTCALPIYCFDRFIQHFGAGNAENLLGRRIEPSNNSMLIRRYDPWWNGFKQRFGQGFLKCDFLVKQSVFKNSGNMLRSEERRVGKGRVLRW